MSVIAILAALFLPALSAVAPFTHAREWTIGQLGAEAVHSFHNRHAASQKPETGRPGLHEILNRAEALQREFGGRPPSPGLRRAITLAALIPVAAVVAGICAVLSLLWLALRLRWIYLAGAIVGLLGCVYAVIASRLLTRAAQAEVAHLLARAQHGLAGLLHGLGIQAQLPHQLSTALGIAPEAGLFVLGLMFIAMLLMPISDAKAGG
ncbi:MAG: hypothetical protein ACRD1Y_06160 [Terriglobales bacterium]